jgi:hypothetical protein
MHSVRLMGGLRAMAPAENDVRFLLFGGTGAVFSHLSWKLGGDDSEILAAQAANANLPDIRAHFAKASGFDFGIDVDVGVELDFTGIILDLVVQNVVQTTAGLAPEDVGESAFGDRLIWFIGPAIRPGFEFF